MTPLRRLVTRLMPAALSVAVAGGLSFAAAHATLVIGTLTLAPDPAAAAETLDIAIDLEDPGLVEVEDAVIFLELRPAAAGAASAPENEQPRGEALFVSDRIPETAAGHYQIQIPTPAAGSYLLSVRDRTYRQEEAVANLNLTIGNEPVGELVFVLPPTDIGPASLASWLLWLIGVPLVAGVVVTILVLRGGGNDDDEASDEAEDEASDEANDEAELA